MFTVNTYNSESRHGLNIPSGVVELLGLKTNDADRDIAISVASPEGEIFYHGIARLASNTEIHSGEVPKHFPVNQRVIVTVSRPPGR
jgi:hypothetical protein